MSVIGSLAGALPGLDSAYTTYQSEFQWGGPPNRGLIKGEVIVSTAVDAGASPTTRLRRGLVLGKIASSGKLREYTATATDGSAVAYGVLMVDITMTDVFAGTQVDRFVPVLVGGPVQAGKLNGLNQQARNTMNNRFVFDDDPNGNTMGWQNVVAKTANYTVTASDNNVIFTNQGATAAVVFTLPTIAKGLRYRFFAESSNASATLEVASATANTMVTFNDDAASSVVFNTANEIVGGALEVVANANATKWLVFLHVNETQTPAVT